MSMITRCPACQTQFKVVPDQLRISEGWVRCGQCQQVFDAALQQVAPEPAPATAPVSQTAPLGLSGSPPDFLIEPVPAAPELAPSDVELSAVSFLRAGQPQSSFWRATLLRLILAVLGGALVLGLAAQIVLHERDRIASHQPGLKAALQAMCAPLHCAVAPLRQIESIVIDSATLGKMTGDTYRLNFVIKNTAAIALALPALELTLTDTLDQPIVRRVFLPAQLGATGDTLAGGAEWPGSLAMTVKAAATSEGVIGYRVLVFYP